MSYTPPAADAVDFDLQPGYIPPAADAVDFDLGGTGPEPVDDPTGALLATTDDASASVTATHGVSAALSATTSAHATITATAAEAYSAQINATTDPAISTTTGAHGTNATLAATTDDAAAAATAAHGRSVQINTSTHDATAQITATRGVTGTIAATTDAATAQINAQMIVYCLSGGVLDENGFALERTVRAHRLDDGTLAAETVSNTETGIFDFNVGFESGEFYVVALDTGPEGTDYLPPITNRVTSVLRHD